ncbi:response regulator [Cohnella sp. CFH 77786]|uniref:response regulator transcription factor n=1 Tax=Cohnella sp. CFH 77786 TaxID=2662265 RepID=UPI001C610E68|nr:response regulator [Cohnella sp. CFH 77786]MBW5444812.1 response regulator [Cohnella sp. CFH 77786]
MAPYRVLIVDDEPEIRRGIVMKVDWPELGLAVGGEASNGQEAMALLEADTFDLVITDMHMPLMNGVEFLQACSGHYPNTKLIVLTGYDDFQYAKAAVRHQAKDYLLKPVVQVELVESLRKAVRDLDGERAALKDKRRMEWQLSRNLVALREQFVLFCVKDSVDAPGGFLEEARRIGLEDWDGREVRFAVIDMGTDPGRKPYRLPFELLCRELAGGGETESLVFRDPAFPHLMQMAVSVPDEDGEAADTRMQDRVRGIRETIEHFLGFGTAAGFGRTVRGFREWKHGYLAALLDWSERQEKERTPACEAPVESLMTPEMERQLVYLLKTGKKEAFMDRLNSLLASAERHSPRMLSRTVFYACLALESAALEHEISLPPEQRTWLQPDWIWNAGSWLQARERLENIADFIMERISRAGETKDKPLFEEVKAFIDDNLASDITLTLLAERYHYNPSYFSELFRTYVGQPFSDYIAEARLAKAARLLLQTDVPLAEIGELCGYANPSYFSTAFKKRYGESPSQHRLRKTDHF